MILETIETKKDHTVITFGNNRKMVIDTCLVEALDLSSGAYFDLNRLREENEDFAERYATDKAFSMLAASAQTEKELRNKLYDKHIQSSGVKAAIAKMKDYGYIDDESLAQNAALSLISQLRGPGYIRDKLTARGIEERYVAELINDIYPEALQKENALKLAASVNRALSGTPPRMRYEKLMRKLMNRGFSSSVSSYAVQSVLKDAEDDHPEDYEEYFAPRILKRAKALIGKGNEMKTVRMRLRGEFIPKGADENIIEKVLDSLFSDE